MTAATALVLVAHGTVGSLDELEAFATRIRRGHKAPPELVAELRRRYEAIGGRSPLNAINASLAKKVEAKLGVTTRLANRLAAPYVDDVIAGLAKQGVTRVASVPLAQYSAAVYARAVEDAAKKANVAAACAKSWATDPAMIALFASHIEETLATWDRAETSLVLTAHSLPKSAIAAGDTYEKEVRAAASAFEHWSPPVHAQLAFQSQGMSGPGVEWLGPDLPTAIAAAKAHGSTRVVFAPIGFLADHVEVLYDLDVEARALVEGSAMTYARVASPNDSDAMVDVIVRIARPLIDGK